jgi:hypothetical protein
MRRRSRSQIAAWLGEFFREAAVLIAVLGPMELLIQNGFLTWAHWALIFVLTVSFAGAGFYAGLKGNAGQNADE